MSLVILVIFGTPLAAMGQIECANLFYTSVSDVPLSFRGSKDGVVRTLPLRLYRIIRGRPEFSLDGFLVSHSQQENRNFWFSEIAKQSESVPMISMGDIELVARFIFSPRARDLVNQEDLYLLEIDSRRIEKPDGRKHPLVRDLEYFGLVSRDAIISVRTLRFVSLSSGEQLNIPATAPDLLKRTYENTANLKIEIE